MNIRIVDPRSDRHAAYRRAVIPALILIGLVLGRWWRVVIPLASVAWAALLIATGVDSGVGFAIGAATLAGINTAFGVLVFRLVRASAIRIRRGLRHRTS